MQRKPPTDKKLTPKISNDNDEFINTEERDRLEIENLGQHLVQKNVKLNGGDFFNKTVSPQNDKDKDTSSKKGPNGGCNIL